MHHPPQRTIYVKVSLMVLRRWMPRCGKGSGEESCWTSRKMMRQWDEESALHVWKQKLSKDGWEKQSRILLLLLLLSSFSSPHHHPDHPHLHHHHRCCKLNIITVVLLVLFVSSVPGAFIILFFTISGSDFVYFQVLLIWIRIVVFWSSLF